MTYTFLTNLLRAFMVLGVASSLAFTASGQDMRAAQRQETSGDSGTTVSERSTPGNTGHTASQIAIPSHGRILTLKTAEGKMTVSCDAVNSQSSMQPPQQSGARQSAGVP